MENRTRLRNSDYPDNDAATADQNIVFTINKVQEDICQLRFDFTTFVLAGPANTQENIGTNVVQTTNTHCTVDSLTITTPSDVVQASDTSSASLCGVLTGEHLYVDLSPNPGDTAEATITTNPDVQPAADADRVWDIKVSQIECFSSYRAPAGCHRYLTASTGTIASLNFAQLANNQGFNTGIELAAQNIKTCIRRAKGMCCVEYQVCATFGGAQLGPDTNAFAAVGNRGAGANGAATFQVINPGWSLDTNTYPFRIDTAGNVIVNGANVIFNSQINIGMVDAQCSGDYVEIPSSWSGGCGSGHGSARNTINSRYCGARFGANFQSGNVGSGHTPVCDCSEPFVVRHNSDTVNDVGGTGAAVNDIGQAAGTAGDQAVNANNLGSAVPRGFCLDYKQLPCWH
jgi:hypothetical protein